MNKNVFFFSRHTTRCLVVLLVELWLLLSGITVATSSIIVQNKHTSKQKQSPRELVWAQADLGICDATTFQQLQQVRGPTMEVCRVGSVTWDPNNILVSEYVFTVAIDEYTDRPRALTAYSTKYNGNLPCNSFDRCINLNNNRALLLDQFEYDCSNVYCGPNAIRNCSGETLTVPCTDNNLSSTPEIPSYEYISCQKARQSVSDDDNDSCTQCFLVEPTDGDDSTTPSYYQFTCYRPCTECFTDGNCVIDGRTEHDFYPQYSTVSNCETLSQSGDEVCFKIAYGAEEISTDPSRKQYSANACLAFWNEELCTCTVCGYDQQGEPLISVDCTEQVGDDAIFDWCTNTYTGVFTTFVLEYDDNISCPAGTEELPANINTGGSSSSTNTASNPTVQIPQQFGNSFGSASDGTTTNDDPATGGSDPAVSNGESTSTATSFFSQVWNFNYHFILVASVFLDVAF